jgi:hypothetical protein
VISEVEWKFPRAAGTCRVCTLSRTVYPAKQNGEDIWVCAGCTEAAA